MKTILLPSDFSMESVHVAETVVRESKEDLRLVFTHLFHVADDIQDLLFSSYREKEYELVPEEFWKECTILKDLYSKKLLSVKVAFYYGNKLASFKNFLDYHQADHIAYSESYGIPKLKKSSIEALPVLKKCGLPLMNTDLIADSALSTAREISGLK